MKTFLASLLLCTALIAPGAAIAAEATITTTLVNYSGPQAYFSIYVTKPDGTYDSTLWLAGSKTRYLGDLRGWVSALQSSGASLTLDGISGASVGSGQTLTIHVNLADTMIDAGYKIHVETAVEHGGDYADDAVVPITAAPQKVDGAGYVRTLSVKM
ncbi:MAG: DUF2271 domain-containing protein [Devosia sp.]